LAGTSGRRSRARIPRAGPRCRSRLDAQHLGLLARRLQFLALAEIGGEGHDLAAVLRLEPFQDDRGVEAAGIGEHDFLGLDACEVAFDESLCTQVVCENAPVEILNLSTHPEFSTHPAAVNPPFVRAYCGLPLVSPEGLTIGAMAIVDTAPFFRFSDEDREALNAATQVTRRLIFGDRLDEAHSEAAE
jgi:GAF domain-containing protein